MKDIDKDNCMLCDVQYMRQNKRMGTPDYLYIIWKDLRTQKKHLEIIESPKITIYFEKDEARDHEYNKTYARLENLKPMTIRYKDLVYVIADEIGPEGKQILNNAFQTRDYDKINKTMLMYPYVFGADYNPVSWYRIQWLQKMDNDKPKKLSKGFLDIEVDGIEVPGMPSPQDCPINAVTLIDAFSRTSYTFLYVYRPYVMKVGDDPEKGIMYESMHEEQKYMMDHQAEFIQELHDMFDESYGDLEYKLYFYDDERKMLVHLFQLINKLKLDFIGIWNISFDIPYIIDRMNALGLEPTEIICHPDFPVKQCKFKPDLINHDVKNKSDTFLVSSYTNYIDQMELYASIRKGASELRSVRLNAIAKKELKDSKLDYSEDGDIKTLPYTNFKKFVIYNIKDVLLQMGIENRTSDFDTLYVSSYKNATPYDKVFRQTVKLRNVQYLSFLSQGLIPGSNTNIYNIEPEVVERYDDEDDEDEEDDAFEGALVADPRFNDYMGLELYGKKTNNIFTAAVDFDMGAFYPNTIILGNIDPNCLIFKMSMPVSQFDLFGGNMRFRGITGDMFEKIDDASKECIDNFQTGNYLTFGHKWLNLPSMDKIAKKIEEKLGG